MERTGVKYGKDRGIIFPKNWLKVLCINALREKGRFRL